MLIIGLILVIAFWLVDAFIDTTFFDTDKPFRQALFSPAPVELWMRSVITILLIVFGAYADRALAAQRKALQLIDVRTQELEVEIETRKHLEQILRELANTDPLTLAYNRRHFYEFLDRELERARRYQATFSVVLCDLDHFKDINDRFGHHVGDEALKMFCDAVRANIRSVDILARWGGEEFVVLAPGVSLDAALVLAEKMRNLAQGCVVGDGANLSISAGVTEYRAGDDADSLMIRADHALYKAKEQGRNRAVSAD